MVRPTGFCGMIAIAVLIGGRAALAGPEDGISFDIAGGGQTVITSVGPAVAAAPFEAGQGSGATVANMTLSLQELGELDEAEPHYAPYEEIKLKQDPDTGRFVPFSVIQPDTREPVTDTTQFPSRAIVQILFTTASGKRKVCSGFMVARSVALTAGHCVFGSGQWHRQFQVYAARNGAVTPFGWCGAQRLYAIDGWINPQTADRRQYDLGAIELDCPIGDRTGWFGLQTLPDDAAGRETFVSGYPSDREVQPNGRQWFSRDTIRELTDLNVFYQNDTFGGMSGAPVFTEGDDHVFAVHTNGLYEDQIGSPWSANNAATRLTDIRIKTLQAWMGE